MSQQGIADAVVVGAGSSRRMGGQDKLEADLAGRPVLRWSVETLAGAPEIADVVVVVGPDRVARASALPWLRELGARIVAGGPRRQDSVAVGVRSCRAPIVLVHDAARPLVSTEVISRVVVGVQRHGAAVPILPVVDALKRVEGDRVTGMVDRTGLYRAQTPQGARRELLLAAVDAHAAGADEIPDEVELLHRAGVEVASVPGDAVNIKLTMADDLELARRLAAPRTGWRTAMGSDSHPFGPDMGLRLGGVTFEEAPRLHGHSDSDVVLHALCDGLLAAAGAGDLGRLFPSGDPATRGIDSRALVADVLARLEAAGLAPRSVDVTILAARPRLGGARLDAIAESIAGLVRLERAAVSVKAASGNLSGDEGAGRTIGATCLVSVVDR